MAAHWPVIDALLGGTSAMREGGESFLPKWPAEDETSYITRKSTATLFPALSRTVSVMVGKPFSKEMTLSDDMPAPIKTWSEDFDLQGNSIHAFSGDVMSEVLGPGFCGVLVDFPTVTKAAVKTLTDERSLGVRPYAVFIKHEQILGWQSKIVGGTTMLTQLRIAECREVADGQFGTASIPRVRVLTPGAFEIYEENDKKEYVLVDAGTTSLNVIPFVPFYGKKDGFMMGGPPLLDLAYLNVKHWQSQSDQDTILHVARVPILAVIGIDDDKWELKVGASTAVKLPLGSDMKFVEHSGAAIAAGEKALESLEEHMIQTGAELIVKRPGQQRTATQDDNEAEANKSDLQRIVESFEDSLDSVLGLFALWVGEKVGGTVSLFKDFGASTLSDASAQLIVALQQAGLITKKTAITEQQRRGMLSPDIDPDTELSDVDLEGPPLGTVLDPVTGEPMPMNPDGTPAEIDPVTGKPKDPTAAKPTDAPAVDLSPVLDGISALIAKLESNSGTTPQAVDFAPLVEAMKALQAPVVNVPAQQQQDLAPLVEAVKQAVEAMRNAPPPNFTNNVAAPAPAPEPATPEPRGPRNFVFITDKNGDITGAVETGPDGRAINFINNGDGIAGARMT